MLSVKNYQLRIKHFQRASKKQKNVRRSKFFTLRVNRALNFARAVDFKHSGAARQ